RSSGRVAERLASTPSSEAMGVPYGGVPDGYAAPPRPLDPADELSVSRLKAGSSGWVHRLFRTPQVASRARAKPGARGRLGGAHHHTGRRWSADRACQETRTVLLRAHPVFPGGIP